MVSIAVTREVAGETRVAATPESVRKLAAQGASFRIERSAGLASGISDSDFEAVGAIMVADAAAALDGADLVFKVRMPGKAEIAALKKEALVVGLLDPYQDRRGLRLLAMAGVSALAMEFIPRISRAQSMDALSSQANLAGYRAVIEGASAFGRAIPLMMTAAGTIAAAKVFIMGVGVAGLQAIATARRLGAVVTATDVRPATKEQVESLGAKFVAVEDEEFKAAETAAGYARAMSSEYQTKQSALVGEHLKKQDIVITTALIPGRPAPRLLTAPQIGAMKAGSVIIDLAAAQGGNAEGVFPDQTIRTTNGVSLIGISNLPGRIAADASALYARNLLALSSLLIKEGGLAPDFEDEILKASLVVRNGAIVHPALQEG